MGRVYQFGHYQLHVERRTLLNGATVVAVPARAFDVLLALVEQRHRVVDKLELLSRVWPDQAVEESNLTQQIFVLRRLLGGGRFIATVPRRGYQFVAEVAARVLPGEPGAVPAATRRLRLDLALDPALRTGPVTALTLSRDARVLIYTGELDGATALFVRSLDGYATRLIAGTEGGSAPFVSPDGRWVGFSLDGTLRRVAIDGGSPITLCEVDGVGRGASWGTDNLVVFAPQAASGLYVVSAAGGSPRPLTRLAYLDGERSHRFPQFIGDGRDVIFTVARQGDATFDDARLAVTAVDSGRHRVLLDQASCGRAVRSCEIHYQRGGFWFVTGFDAATGECAFAGEPLQAIAVHEAGAAHAAVSDAGLLVAVPPAPVIAPARLTWRSLTGDDQPCATLPGVPEEPRLSPSGREAVVGVRAGRSDLWLVDLATGMGSRLTDTGDNFAGLWTPDGRGIVFSSNRSGATNLYRIEVGTHGDAAQVTVSASEQIPGAWTPNGGLIFTQYDAQTGASLWLRAPDGEVVPLLRSRSNHFGPSLSADGRLLAYTSDASGLPEVCVIRYPSMTGLRQLSQGGGGEPVWTPDGAHLVYRAGGSFVQVAFDADGVPGPETRVAAAGSVPGSPTGPPNYAVHTDGRLLIATPPIVQSSHARLHAVITCPATS